MELRDQYHDPSYAVLYHLLQDNPAAADFVKHAELDDTKVAELPDSAFAWPEHRMFPINTPENTVLSSLYREKCAAVPVEVDEALTKARDIYGVNEIVAQTKTAAAPPPVSDDDFLLPKHKRLLVKNASDVKAAEQVLLEQYPRLSIEDRAEGFINLVKKARDLNVSLAPKTHQMAGMTICTTKTAMDWIEARRCATEDPLFSEAFEKLSRAMAVKGEFIHDRDELVEVANTLAKLDKMAGIDNRYDRTLPDPIQTIFNTEKLAEEMVDLDGREVALSKLAALPATFWEDVVGPDLVKEITTGGNVDSTKLAMVLPTLPLDLRMVLKHQVP